MKLTALDIYESPTVIQQVLVLSPNVLLVMGSFYEANLLIISSSGIVERTVFIDTLSDISES